MRKRLRWLLMWQALSLSLGCGWQHSPERRAERPPEQSPGDDAKPPRPAPAPPLPKERFEPPDDSGWGHAEGLRYLEQIAGNADAAQALPMVVMIHGLGDRPRAGWFGELDLPVRIIMPQAPKPYSQGFSWFDYRVGDQNPAALAHGIGAAAARLAKSLATLAQQRPTAGAPIVCGFSQGGMLSYALALHHPEVVGLAHPIAGMLPQPLWPGKRAPGKRYPKIRAAHGDADTIVSIDADRALVAHLAASGYDATLAEFSGVGHQVSDAMGDLMYRLVAGAATGDDSM